MKMITKILRVLLVLALAGQITIQPSSSQSHSAIPSLSTIVFKGIQVFPNEPFKLQLILDQQESSSIEDWNDISMMLMKYFLAAVTIPEEDLWVNLSPYESGRIIPGAFGQTAMGQDLLAMDFELKKLTASLMDPDSETGNQFWSAWNALPESEKTGADIFSKVWIVPESADVYVKEHRALITQSFLAVMTEQDVRSEAMNSRSPLPGDVSPRTSSGPAYELFKRIVVPHIQEEVNTSRTFLPLRQMYHAMILASWYKKAMPSLLGDYMDQREILGIESGDAKAIERIYANYKDIFKSGSFDVIREEYDPATSQMIPKHYFSGGFSATSDRGSLSTMWKVQGQENDKGVLRDPLIADFDLDVVTDKAQLDPRSHEHPLKRIAADQNLREFIIKLQTKRYQRWGLSETLIREIVEELVRFPDDPEAARQAVYSNVIDFNKDKGFKAAYTRYKDATKYGSTHEVIETYLQELEPGSVVLDVGAGTNGLMRALAVKDQYRDLKFVGTEVYDYRSDSDKEGDETIENLKFVSQEGVARLPFEDHSVSLMTLNFVIHHVDWENQDAFLAELRRVLKPDGKIIFFEDTFSINLFFDDLQSDVDLSRNFFELYAADPRNAYDVISFLDWYSNIVVLGLTGMNMPFSFRSMEDWFDYFKSNQLYMISASFHGFREDKFHNSIHGIMVLSPDSTQAVDRFVDLKPLTHTEDLKRHQNLLKDSSDLNWAMGMYAQTFISSRQLEEVFSTGANEYRMSYQDRTNGFVRLDIISRFLGEEPVFSITYDFFNQTIKDVSGRFLDDRGLLEYFLSSYYDVSNIEPDPDWLLELLARVLNIPETVSEKVQIMAREKLSFLSRVSSYEDMLHDRQPFDNKDRWLPIPHAMIPKNQTTAFLTSRVFKMYLSDGTRVGVDYFFDLDLDSAVVLSNNHYKTLIIIEDYPQWKKNSMINALRRGMTLEQAVEIYGQMDLVSREGFVMTPQGIFVAPMVAAEISDKAMLKKNSDGVEQTYGGVQFHSRFVNIHGDIGSSVQSHEIFRQPASAVLGIRPILQSIHKMKSL